MKSKVYLETSIVSYLTARPSRDLVIAANQETTNEWWSACRGEYDLYVSQLVFVEASAGDPEAAQRRIEAINPLTRLDISDQAIALGKRLAADIPLPTKAKADALHIALAAVNGMNYLLTWNCAHIANAVLRSRIDEICRQAGYEPPVICTPLELFGKGEVDA